MKERIRALEQSVRNFVAGHLKLTILIIIVMIAGFTFVSVEALHFSSAPAFCEHCQPVQKVGPLSEVHTWKKSAHAAVGVQCLDCHGNPGFIGYMRAKMGGLYDVYGEFFKSPEHKLEILKKSADPVYAAKLVPSDTCLFCHSDAANQRIRKDTVMTIGLTFRMMDKIHNPDFRKKAGLTDILAEGVKPNASIEPKHAKHADKGIGCVQCHIGVAHSGEKKPKTKMQTCFDCHDKNRTQVMPANENCMACHKTEEGLTPKEAISFGTGEAAVKFSHDTHSAMAKCNECHTGVFPMKKGQTKIAFDDHAAGKFCFSCHTGKKAFSYTNCKDCHAKTPFPKNPVVYKMKDAAPVSFSHEFHVEIADCAKCHPKTWQMKKSARKMTMDAMYAGKFCGKCHNEKDAFAATDCDKCHIEPKKN